MVDKVIVQKEYLQFDGVKLYPPIEKAALEAVLGAPTRIEEAEGETLKFRSAYVFWDGTGIWAGLSADGKYYDDIEFNVSADESLPDDGTGIFAGEIYIGTKPYHKCKMKLDFDEHTLKKGPFEVETFLMEDIDKVEEQFRYMAERMSHTVGISYEVPKEKTVKYKQKKGNGNVLSFTNFNFKLAVIQELMYNKELIEPKFDIYEFAEEYSGRKIDIDEEGYDPIEEAVDRFKKLEIPEALADEVTELYMDGGDDVYLQIYPFWDGEDDYFDLKAVTPEELAQFKNLKKMTVMSENYDEVAKILNECGIETERL